MKRFLAGFFQPGDIFGVLQAIDHLLILLDGQDDGDGLASPRDHFGFLGEGTHGVRLTELGRGVNFGSLISQVLRMPVELMTGRMGRIGLRRLMSRARRRD